MTLGASAAAHASLEQSRTPLMKSWFLQRQEASGVLQPNDGARFSMLVMQVTPQDGKLAGNWATAVMANAPVRTIEYFILTIGLIGELVVEVVWKWRDD
jgi:hypothetical protein